MSTLAQTLLIDDLGSTVVTEPVQDAATGLYIREYRFYAPAVEGTVNLPLLLTVRVQADEPETLRFKTGEISI